MPNRDEWHPEIDALIIRLKRENQLYKNIVEEVNRLPAAINPKPRKEGAIKRRWLLKLKMVAEGEPEGEEDDEESEGFFEEEDDEDGEENLTQDEYTLLLRSVREIEHEFEKVKFKLMADRYGEILKSERKEGMFRKLTDEVAKEFLRMGPPNIEAWCKRWEGKTDWKK